MSASNFTVTQDLELSATGGAKTFFHQEDGIMHLTGKVSVTTDANPASTVSIVTRYGTKELFLDGVLSGTGALSINSIVSGFGRGIVHFTNGGNTYSGTISVNDHLAGINGTDFTRGGILRIDADNAAQFATINLAGNTSGGLLHLNAANVTIAGLTGSGPNSAVHAIGATVRTLTINNAVANTFGASIGLTSVTNSANIALVKSGIAALTLTGMNQFNGGTTVTAGTLMTGNTAALGTASVLVTGGTLQIGNGAVKTITLGSGANLVINGGTLKLDATLGTTTPAITLTGGGTYTFNGTLDLSGVFDTAINGTYTLISGGTGTDTMVTINGFATGPAGPEMRSATFSQGLLTIVPEPSTYGLLGAGALAFAGVIRRRRRA